MADTRHYPEGQCRASRFGAVDQLVICNDLSATALVRAGVAPSVTVNRIGNVSGVEVARNVTILSAAW